MAYKRRMDAFITMLKIKTVSKQFSGTPVLTSVSLSVPDGTTHVLLGSSGSGKSTLLKIVMGLVPADQGTVHIGSAELNSKFQPEWVRKIGYVPQDGGLFPHLTAAENVILVASTLGWDRARLQRRIEELSKVVSIEPGILRQYPRELSGGQRQRVALMRADFLDPDVLLLDEPLGALDPLSRFEVQTELKEIFLKLKKTVLFVTHDINEAAYLGESVSLLNQGSLIQSGPFKELLLRPSDPFVTRFINAQRNWSID
jgi:osmoprotectant transport system ATP-binding protein